MKALEIEIPEGQSYLLGFDTNCVVTEAQARAFFRDGYRFAMRYVPRVKRHDNDFSTEELARLLNAGLAVGAVQHVESESSWTPTAAKGQSYGTVAGAYATDIGLPLDTMVYCDLEGVATNVGPALVMDYCAAWHAQVLAAGFTPGLYVGWRCGLSPAQLYALPFTHYWGAYNLNRDEEPADVGISMKQLSARPPEGCPDIDADKIIPDKRGRLPILCVPDEWPA